AGEEFTETRLLKSVADAKERNATEIIDVVVRDAKRFAGDAEQHDDMTMVVVKVH
ncbi:MAG: SpoIIE family protein phosphatase, partial [Bacteroidetes bacterium]|nr:SpoIIE family protein phosphatase [Bacteroidota bacterium]